MSLLRRVIVGRCCGVTWTTDAQVRGGRCWLTAGGLEPLLVVHGGFLSCGAQVLMRAVAEAG